MDLYLREATDSDMDLLFEWANDKDVRKNSFNSEPIPYENHVKWFNRIMSDDTVLQFIMCDRNEPIGQIRLNIEGDRAYIGYSISPDRRGQGFGERMLKLTIGKVKEENAKNHNIKTLVGQVKYENPASARAFEKCGFSRLDKEGCIEYCYYI